VIPIGMASQPQPSIHLICPRLRLGTWNIPATNGAAFLRRRVIHSPFDAMKQTLS
jgi:hypothetical protein